MSEQTGCPFYGYHAILGLKTLARTGGNQCALVTTAFAPCRMELSSFKPNWERCPLNGRDPDLAGDLLLFTRADMGRAPAAPAPVIPAPVIPAPVVRLNVTAWQEGFKAGEEQDLVCPYRAGTVDAWSWHSGQVEGEAKRQGAAYSMGPFNVGRMKDEAARKDRG